MAFFIRTVRKQFRCGSGKSVFLCIPNQLWSPANKNCTLSSQSASLRSFFSSSASPGPNAEDVDPASPVPVDRKTEPVSRDLFDLNRPTFSKATCIGTEFRRPIRHSEFQFSYAGHRFLLTGHLYLRLGIAYQRFDFGDDRRAGPHSSPERAGVIGVDYMHNDDVGAFLQLRPGFYTENDFDSASFDVPMTLGRVFVLQQDSLYFFAGANAAFLRGQWPVIPIAGLIWMPDDKWKVMAMLPEPRIIYVAGDKLCFWGGGELSGGSFRTDRDTMIIPIKTKRRAGRLRRIPGGRWLHLLPSDNFTVNLGGGYVDRTAVRFPSGRHQIQGRRRAFSAARGQDEVLRCVVALRCAMRGRPASAEPSASPHRATGYSYCSIRRRRNAAPRKVITAPTDMMIKSGA